MAEVTTYPPGTFCWVELATTDRAAAQRFYNGLFGWEARDRRVAPDRPYTIFQLKSLDLAGLYQERESDIGQEGGVQWLAYVSVAQLEDTLRRAGALGARLLRGPTDVADLGRAALIRDPEGAVLGVWQPQRYIGASIVNETGAMCWNELAARNAASVTPFYTKLFGWTPKISAPGPDAYTELLNGVVPAAGMREIRKKWGNIRPQWLTYFAVESCDDTAAKARTLGAGLQLEPSDIPAVGRYAVMADPQGARFAVIQPA